MIRRQVGPRRHLAFYLIMSFFVLSAFGCGSGGGGSSSDSTPTTPGTPLISTQGVLDFGTVVIPDSPARILTIANDGTAALNIGTISLQQPTGTPFTIINDNCSNKSIAPSGTCSVGVQLSTTAASPQNDSTNTLSIPSNDSASNPLTLAMAGKVRKFLVSINEIIKNPSCSLTPKILRLLVSVTDNVGPVTNLSGANFTVYENDPNLTNP